MKNLFTKTKVFSASLVLAMAFAGSASAATITFGNASNLNGVAQVAADGSGLTSVNVPASNLTNGSNGFFVETFDKATQTLQPDFIPDPNVPGGFIPNPNAGDPYPAGTMAYNDSGFADCAVNGVGSGITVATNGVGAFGVRKGSVPNKAAAPADDSTCFGYTPQLRSSLPSWVEVDYSAFLASAGDVGITFLGFYWGSIDTYNDFTFYSGNQEIQTITGNQLLNQSGGTSGNQQAPGSNVYVAIDFSLSEAFDKVRITSRRVAGEFDNIVIGLQNRPIDRVPAPAGLAFLALGLLGLGLKKRLSK
jgi:hypothetical protein